MDFHHFINYYYLIPPITRYYQTACVIVTVLVQLGILTPFHLYFNSTLILKHGQIWRLFTSFLFFGTLGFNFLFNMVFTFKYCEMLEEVSFHNRTADFIVMLLFGATCTIIIAFFIHVLFLSQPLTIMLVYIWCRRNPHSVMNFFGVMNFNAPYLPWVLLAFSLLLGNSISSDIIGIIVGHSYYFLEDIFPNLRGGRRILKTPQFLAIQNKEDKLGRKKMKRIKIYNDIGVSDECIEHMLFSLQKFSPKNTLIELLNADDILNTNVLHETDLFILPGGADLKYIMKLHGKGDEKIRNFIKNGGSYLAICAGAYYSSNYCEFAKDTNLEICGQRELAIFSGTVRGPTLATYDYNSNSGARAAKIKVKGLNLNECFIFYNGGGSFVNATQMPDVEVIGIYENYEAAIIKVNYGQGIAILSGVHPEYDPELIKQTIPYSGLEKLQTHNSDRVYLLRSLLKILGVY